MQKLLQRHTRSGQVGITSAHFNPPSARKHMQGRLKYKKAKPKITKKANLKALRYLQEPKEQQIKRMLVWAGAAAWLGSV